MNTEWIEKAANRIRDDVECAIIEQRVHFCINRKSCEKCMAARKKYAYLIADEYAKRGE